MSLRNLAGDNLQLVQVAIGLSIGTAARYAMRLQDRLPIGLREIAIDLLLLGFNALLTLWAIDKLGATGKGAVLTAALFAVGQDRVVRLARRWFEKRAARMLDAAGLGEDDQPVQPPRKVAPTPHGTPDTPAARAGAALRATYRKTARARPPEDMIEALRKLDGDDAGD